MAKMKIKEVKSNVSKGLSNYKFDTSNFVKLSSYSTKPNTISAAKSRNSLSKNSQILK
jgi:hypothetical protein